MRILAMASQKGGVGKSTLAYQLACIAGENGPAYLVDRDEQATTRRWADRRGKREPTPDQPALLDIGTTSLTDAARKLQSQPGTLIIDTRPEISEPVAEAVRVAGLVIVPVRPSLNDLEAVPATLSMVQRLGRRAVIVINAARTEARVSEARAALQRWPVPICPHSVSDRTVFLDAAAEGASIAEMRGAAARSAEIELRKTWAWIVEQGHD